MVPIAVGSVPSPLCQLATTVMVSTSPTESSSKASSAARYFRQVQLPVRATTRDGSDITHLVKHADLQAARERAAREKAARDKAAREKAARDRAAREKAAREKAAREQAARRETIEAELRNLDARSLARPDASRAIAQELSSLLGETITAEAGSKRVTDRARNSFQPDQEIVAGDGRANLEFDSEDKKQTRPTK